MPTSYDVFVSYSSGDLNWVSDELLPRLRDADLKVAIDYENFVVGVPILENIGHAFRQSRRTVAVITDSWLTDRWSKHSSVVVLSADVQEGKRRFVPVKFKVNTQALPDEIATLEFIDFTNPDLTLQQVQWDRLLGQLRRDEAEHGLAPRPTAAVKKAFRTLASLMAESSTIAAEVAVNRDFFEDVTDRIDVLTHYKCLHDQLHLIQILCHKPLALIALIFPHPTARLELAECANQLKALTNRLQLVARHPCFSPTEVQWIDKLLKAHKKLDPAINKKDAQCLKQAKDEIARVITTEPSKIDRSLSVLTNQLPLPKLVQRIRPLQDRLVQLGVEHTKVEELNAAADKLEALDRDLKGQVGQHFVWQGVDDLLRATENQLNPDEEDLTVLEQTWPELMERAQPLFEGQFAAVNAELKKAGETLQTALAARESFNALAAFRDYRAEATRRFNEVDSDLLDFCDDLYSIGRSLKLLMR